MDSCDAFHLKKVLDEVGECEALQRIGRRCASKERVGETVGERGARRGRRELWDMVDCEVVGGGHRPVTAGGADDCVCTKPGEGSLHELMCADERASFGTGAVSDGKPDANGVGGTSEDLLRERARDVTRLHLSALPGSKSVELLISSTAIRKAAKRPTLVAVCWNSPPNRTSAETPMMRTRSAVLTPPKERRTSSCSMATGIHSLITFALYWQKFRSHLGTSLLRLQLSP